MFIVKAGLVISYVNKCVNRFFLKNQLSDAILSLMKNARI